ncbi:hypothetical protein AVEN_213758-1 [Araneus ventricosus]|uniref:Uncharacterized protein n=1 Tax=Araneus ventricosus TaxID=182803 RepID=A0A4Y2VVP0_ARAVE|nr:hypothetical protein AVEN_213758-1 [Araneus ventricosus]
MFFVPRKSSQNRDSLNRGPTVCLNTTLEEQSEDKVRKQNGGIRLLVFLQGLNKKQRFKAGFFLYKSTATRALLRHFPAAAISHSGRIQTTAGHTCGFSDASSVICHFLVYEVYKEKVL